MLLESDDEAYSDDNEDEDVQNHFRTFQLKEKDPTHLVEQITHFINHQSIDTPFCRIFVVDGILLNDNFKGEILFFFTNPLITIVHFTIHGNLNVFSLGHQETT